MKNKTPLKALTALSLLSLSLFASNISFAYDAPFAQQAPTIDGINNDSAWAQAAWHEIDQVILGDAPSKEDFSGRYKVVWTKEKLYIIGEIVDDVLIDTHADPLDSYWEDDTFEIFLDEDKSGGLHVDNYNAFAYHIAR